MLQSNPDGWSLTGQVLSLFSRCHQFECHKPQVHWRLTWPLTSGSRRISQCACKLTQTPTVNKYIYIYIYIYNNLAYEDQEKLGSQFEKSTKGTNFWLKWKTMKGQRILGSNEKQWPMKKKINGHRFGLKIIIFF
jgi:hypothetical protein